MFIIYKIKHNHQTQKSMKIKKLLFLIIVLFCITSCKQDIRVDLAPGYKLKTLSVENGVLSISAEPMEDDYVPRNMVIETPGVVRHTIVVNETR